MNAKGAERSDPASRRRTRGGLVERPPARPGGGRKRLFDQWQTHARALHDRVDPEARQVAADTLLGSIHQLRTTVVNLIARLR